MYCLLSMPVISNQDDEYESGGTMLTRARRFVGSLFASLRAL